MNYTFGTSQRSPSTVVSDTVYQSLRGIFFGSVWGMITPFHAPGTALAKAEAATGVFTPAQPFSCIKSVGHNAAILGTIMGVQRFTSKSLELIRQREDYINDIAGFAVTYKYYSYFIGSCEKRLIRHNQIFGGIAIMTFLYSAIV